MTIADKLTAVNSAKTDIKNAITAKGVDMTDVAFADYDTKIAEISTGGLTVEDLKTANIAYNPQGQLLNAGSYINLTATEPATPTVSYTITSGFLPTFTGDSLAAYTPIALLYLTGNNTAGTAQTLNYTVKINSSTVLNSTLSVTAGHKWALTIYNQSYLSVNVNDVIDIYLWGSTSLNCSGYYYVIQANKIKPVDNVNIVMFDTYYYLTQPQVNVFGLTAPSINEPYIYCGAMDSKVPATSGQAYSIQFENSTYGVLRIYYGDVLSGVRAVSNATYWSGYANNVPTQISWKETNAIYS